jgi:hypothetical protein
MKEWKSSSMHSELPLWGGGNGSDPPSGEIAPGTRWMVTTRSELLRVVISVLFILNSTCNCYIT